MFYNINTLVAFSVTIKTYLFWKYIGLSYSMSTGLQAHLFCVKIMVSDKCDMFMILVDH